MTKTAGADAILKKGATPIAGIRMTDVTADATPIDVKDRDSTGFSKMLAGKLASRSLTFSAEGLEEDGVLEAIALDPTADPLITDLSIVLPTGFTITGDFWLSSYKQGHPHEDATTFSANFQSSGAWAFAATV